MNNRHSKHTPGRIDASYQITFPDFLMMTCAFFVTLILNWTQRQEAILENWDLVPSTLPAFFHALLPASLAPTILRLLWFGRVTKFPLIASALIFVTGALVLLYTGIPREWFYFLGSAAEISVLCLLLGLVFRRLFK